MDPVDLNVKHKTVKPLEENINLCVLGLCQEFLDMIPKVVSLRKKTDKLDFQTKAFVLRALFKRMKRQVTDLENICKSHACTENTHNNIIN